MKIVKNTDDVKYLPGDYIYTIFNHKIKKIMVISVENYISHYIESDNLLGHVAYIKISQKIHVNFEGSDVIVLNDNIYASEEELKENIVEE